MYRNILVPLDGSDFAEYALPLALGIAERTAGELQLVSSVPTLPPVVPAQETEGPTRGWFEEERNRASAYLHKVQGRLQRPEGPRIHVRVLEGDPSESLDERIRKTGVDLTVMTTHGRGPFERMWLGSVADGLIRRAPCPILLWRPDHGGPPEEADLEARPRFRRILVPLDGSTASETMIPKAVGMARLFEARLSLVSVVPEPFPLASAYLPHAANENLEHEEAKEDARGYLAQVAERIRSEGIETDFEVVVEDDAGSGILAYREEIGADLVAMSTRGRGGVARLVLGSVADKVIRGGRVPVFLHRQPTEARPETP